MPMFLGPVAVFVEAKFCPQSSIRQPRVVRATEEISNYKRAISTETRNGLRSHLARLRYPYFYLGSTQNFRAGGGIPHTRASKLTSNCAAVSDRTAASSTTASRHERRAATAAPARRQASTTRKSNRLRTAYLRECPPRRAPRQRRCKRSERESSFSRPRNPIGRAFTSRDESPNAARALVARRISAPSAGPRVGTRSGPARRPPVPIPTRERRSGALTQSNEATTLL